MLDMRTVMFSYVITNILITLFIAVLWHQNQKRYAGLSFWLIDFVLQAVGVLLMWLRGIVPDFISIVVGNGLTIAGIVFVYEGMGRFVGKLRTQTLNYLLLAVFVPAMTYFAFIRPDIGTRTILGSVAIALVTAQCARLMLLRVDAALKPITRTVGVVFLLYALAALVRTASLLLMPLPAMSSLFQSPLVQVLFVMIYQMLCIALTFALILMVTRRLELDVQAQDILRRRAEQVLQESHEKFALAFRLSPYAMSITRASDGQMIEVNEGFVNLSGYAAAECVGKTPLELDLWGDEQDRLRVRAELTKGKAISGMELRFRKKDGSPVTAWFSAGAFALGDELCILTSIDDITRRKQVETEREHLIAGLQAALDKVKLLQGILPICMFCKRIRDKDGNWHSMEHYITDHSTAEFSHGLCPDCAREHYPEYSSDTTKK
jgi:PAS domain S-box-containing protein